MEDFEFDINSFIRLAQKRSLFSGDNDYLSKNMIIELKELILEQTADIVDYYCNINREVFKGPFPIIIIYREKIYRLTAGLLFISNTIECVNIPCCIEEDTNLRDAFSKIIISLIQCLNVRLKWQMNLTENIIAEKSYDILNAISSKKYIETLQLDGWNNIIKMPFHTILLNNNSPVTFSIPNEGTISKELHFAFNRYKRYYEGDTSFWK